jgi:virulence factor
MAEKSSVDCVFVVTKPDETHAKITCAFLENGKHVFCEKPMATNISDAKEMVRKAKKHGRILMVGFNRRYMPIFQRAKQEFENPNDIDVCKAEMCQEQTILRGLNTNYVHMIDVLRWFCGEPIKIQANAKYKDPNYEETVVALIEFNSGALGIHICNSNSGGYVERITIHGNHKTIEVDVPSLTFRSLKGGAYQPAIITNFVTNSWRESSYKFGFEQEDRHFIECVKTGENPLTSGEDALKTLHLIDAIYAKCGLPTLK